MQQFEMMRRRDIRSYDGTRLSVFQGGALDGPPLVLANGLGGNHTSWRHLIRHFSDRFRVITWDYRGLYTSGPSSDAGAYSIAHHARDLERVLEATGVRYPVLVGWSMGVQVSLEYLRHRPAGARALVALNGTPGHPFRTAFDLDLHDQMQRIFDFLGRHWTKAVWAKPWVVRRRIVKTFMRTAQLVGLASHRLDEQVFSDLAAQFVDLDIGIYSRIFNCLSEHDASDVLDSLRVPALLVGGDRDKMIPLHRTLLMAARIPDNQLITIRGGTHFTPVEFPDRINHEVEKFLGARDLLPTDVAIPLARVG